MDQEKYPAFFSFLIFFLGLFTGPLFSFVLFAQYFTGRQQLNPGGHWGMLTAWVPVFTAQEVVSHRRKLCKMVVFFPATPALLVWHKVEEFDEV